MREVIEEKGVVVISTGGEPLTTRVWELLPDGRIGEERALFQTYGRREGDAQHCRAVNRARAGEWTK